MNRDVVVSNFICFIVIYCGVVVIVFNIGFIIAIIAITWLGISIGIGNY